VIREVDPAPQASVSVSVPPTPEDVSQLGIAELRALLGEHAAEPSPPGARELIASAPARSSAS
jgi:hypothetical protein